MVVLCGSQAPHGGNVYIDVPDDISNIIVNPPAPMPAAPVQHRLAQAFLRLSFRLFMPLGETQSRAARRRLQREQARGQQRHRPEQEHQGMTPFLPSFKGPALAEQVSAAAKKIENLESKVPSPFGVLSPAAGVGSDNPSNRILPRFRALSRQR